MSTPSPIEKVRELPILGHNVLNALSGDFLAQMLKLGPQHLERNQTDPSGNRFTRRLATATKSCAFRQVIQDQIQIIFGDIREISPCLNLKRSTSRGREDVCPTARSCTPLPEGSFREEVNGVRLLIPRNKDAGDALARNIASTPASSLRQGENIRVRVMGLP